MDRDRWMALIVNAFLWLFAPAGRAALRGVGNHFFNLLTAAAFEARHRGIVWAKPFLVLAIGGEGLVGRFVGGQYATYDIAVPKTFLWLYYGVMLAQLVQLARVFFVRPLAWRQAQGMNPAQRRTAGGPDNQSLVVTAAVTYIGLFICGNAVTWVGGDLCGQILKLNGGEWGDPIWWEAWKSALPTFMVGLLLVVITVRIAGKVALDVGAALLRAGAVVEAAGGTAVAGGITAAIPDYHLADLRREQKERFGEQGILPFLQVFNTNVITRAYHLLAIVILDKILFLRWLSLEIGWWLAITWFIGWLVFDAISDLQIDPTVRIWRPHWGTYLILLVPGAISGWLLVTGPDRSLTEVATVTAIGHGARQVHNVAQHMGTATYLVFVGLFVTYCVLFGLAAKRAWDSMGSLPIWLKYGLIAVAFVIVGYPSFFQLVGAATWTGPSGLLDGFEIVGDWSGSRAWGVGKPLIIILPVFIVLFAVAGWRHSDTSKRIGGWIGVGLAGLICAVLLATVLIGYTRPVNTAVAAPTSDVLPPGTLSRNQSPQCLPELATCNCTSQCCSNLVCYRAACLAL